MGEVTEVEMIRVGEMECIVETTWMGGDWIRTSEMRFGLKVRTVVTCSMGGDATLNVTTGFGRGAENFVSSGALFIATSLVSSSSGSQKKESSETCFRHGDTGDEVNFEGDEIFIGTTS